MERKTRTILALIAGFVAGVAFVVACGSGGGGSSDRRDGGFFDGGLLDAGRDAEAGVPDPCTRWEVFDVHPVNLTDTGEDVSGSAIKAVPEGWEPFAYDERYAFRRCVN